MISNSVDSLPSISRSSIDSNSDDVSVCDQKAFSAMYHFLSGMDEQFVPDICGCATMRIVAFNPFFNEPTFPLFLFLCMH